MEPEGYAVFGQYFQMARYGLLRIGDSIINAIASGKTSGNIGNGNAIAGIGVLMKGDGIFQEQDGGCGFVFTIFAGLKI